MDSITQLKKELVERLLEVKRRLDSASKLNEQIEAVWKIANEIDGIPKSAVIYRFDLACALVDIKLYKLEHPLLSYIHDELQAVFRNRVKVRDVYVMIMSCPEREVSADIFKEISNVIGLPIHSVYFLNKREVTVFLRLKEVEINGIKVYVCLAISLILKNV